MANIILFDSEYITLEYWDNKKLIYHTVHKPIDVAHISYLREALNAGTAALEKYKISKWLSDDRKNGPLPDEQITWAQTDWNPRTIRAGWKYWANVVPESMVAAGSLTPLINMLYEDGLRMMVFSSVEKAIEWLDKMK